MFFGIPLGPNERRMPEVMRARITPDHNGGFWLVIAYEDGKEQGVTFPCKMDHASLKEAFHAPDP